MTVWNILILHLWVTRLYLALVLLKLWVKIWWPPPLFEFLNEGRSLLCHIRMLVYNSAHTCGISVSKGRAEVNCPEVGGPHRKPEVLGDQSTSRGIGQEEVCEEEMISHSSSDSFDEVLFCDVHTFIICLSIITFSCRECWKYTILTYSALKKVQLCIVDDHPKTTILCTVMSDMKEKRKVGLVLEMVSIAPAQICCHQFMFRSYGAITISNESDLFIFTSLGTLHLYWSVHVHSLFVLCLIWVFHFTG